MSLDIDITPDSISKTYWKNNRRFAALCNAALFDGDEIIHQDLVFQRDSEETAVIENEHSIYDEKRRRDLIREVIVDDTSILIGIENQQYKDKTMPVRDMEYAVLNYVNQMINEKHMFLPVFMIILFYGEYRWTKHYALSDIVTVPESLKEVFNDWKPILIDVKEFDYRLIADQEVRDCFQAIQRIHKWKGDNEIFKDLVLTKETALFVSVVTHCKELEKLVEEYKDKEEVNMCLAFDRVLAKERAKEREKTRIEERSNFDLVLEEERSKFNLVLEENRKEMEEKGIDNTYIISIQNIMKNLNLDINKAMELLNIPFDKREKYRLKIN